MSRVQNSQKANRSGRPHRPDQQQPRTSQVAAKGEYVKVAADLRLPASVVSKVDLARLLGELEQVDSDMNAAAVRSKVGVRDSRPLALSQQLTDFIEQNSLSLEEAQRRSALIKQVRQLKDIVPVITLTFAVAADRESLEQLALWVRSEIDPQAVLAVGLQPALIAGVYARTANHVHDMSLRTLLADGREILVKDLEALRGGV